MKNTDHVKREYVRLLLVVFLFAVFTGIFTYLFFMFVGSATHFIWEIIPTYIWQEKPFYYTLLMTTGGGFAVGITIKYIGKKSAPGFSESLDELFESGRINYKHFPEVLSRGFISLFSGASLGPEAMLTDLVGGISTYVSDKLSFGKEKSRIIGFAGIGAFFSAFFSSPVATGVLPVEASESKVMSYYSLMLPTIFAASISYIIFEYMDFSLVEFYDLPPYEGLEFVHIFYAMILSLVGLLLAAALKLFFGVSRKFAQVFGDQVVLKTTSAGIVIGVIGMFFPLTLFSGEHGLEEVIIHGSEMGALTLVLIAVLKLFCTSLALASDFKGGAIFPLIFAGGSVGIALHVLFPFIPFVIAFVSVLTALLTVVMRIPISVMILISSLISLKLAPIIAVTTTFTFLITSSSKEILKDFVPEKGE